MPRCSFCLRPADEVTTLISAPYGDAYICDICSANNVELLRAHLPDFTPRANTRKAGLARVTPRSIKKSLDEYVIGQDEAKKVLSVAVYNHFKRIESETLIGVPGFEDTEIEKANILLMGPTGTGKTLLARTLARILDVPFAVADATTLTEAGYVGDDVESILSALLQSAEYDVSRAERGIVYLDEVDKISRRSDSASITRDVSGEGVQQGLLKLLEGTVAGVPPKGGRKHPEQPLIYINTKHILFIAGGAFDGLEKIILKRMHQNPIGFGAAFPEKSEEKEQNIFQFAEQDDLLKFGFIPELIGRLPVLAALNGLSREALLQILTEPKNALVKQYKKLFAMEGVELDFRADALDAIIDEAVRRGTGARALRSIMEKVLTELMFSLPDDAKLERVTVTRESVEGTGKPITTRSGAGESLAA
ncbi:MAG: ATP-dependent Clp protease ATP-binding subunit ClpX [Bacteroidetes bacterium]|nr:ATP-dependent Clp protease ATP-binding subunit ClpX [Bacteroidota bacterium]